MSPGCAGRSMDWIAGILSIREAEGSLSGSLNREDARRKILIPEDFQDSRWRFLCPGPKLFLAIASWLDLLAQGATGPV